MKHEPPTLRASERQARTANRASTNRPASSSPAVPDPPLPRGGTALPYVSASPPLGHTLAQTGVTRGHVPREPLISAAERRERNLKAQLVEQRNALDLAEAIRRSMSSSDSGKGIPVGNSYAGVTGSDLPESSSAAAARPRWEAHPSSRPASEGASPPGHATSRLGRDCSGVNLNPPAWQHGQ